MFALKKLNMFYNYSTDYLLVLYLEEITNLRTVANMCTFS